VGTAGRRPPADEPAVRRMHCGAPHHAHPIYAPRDAALIKKNKTGHFDLPRTTRTYTMYDVSNYVHIRSATRTAHARTRAPRPVAPVWLKSRTHRSQTHTPRARTKHTGALAWRRGPVCGACTRVCGGAAESLHTYIYARTDTARARTKHTNTLGSQSINQILTKPHTGKEKQHPSTATEGSKPCVTK